MKKILTILFLFSVLIAEAQIPPIVNPGNFQIQQGVKISALPFYNGAGLDTASIPIVINGVNRRTFALYFNKARIDSLVAAMNELSAGSGFDTTGKLGAYQAAINQNAAAIATKQSTLVSGTNIKTVGGQSILGSGDITVASSFDTTGKFTAYQAGINQAKVLANSKTDSVRFKDSIAAIYSQNMVDPRRYGAPTDSTVDATTFIQAAINTGRDINLNGQTYLVSQILPRSNTNIVNGRFKFTDSTIAGIYINGKTNVTLQNISIACRSGRTSVGILINNSLNITVDKVTVSGHGTSGIRATGSINVKLSDNRFFQAATDDRFGSSAAADVDVQGTNTGFYIGLGYHRSGGAYAIHIRTNSNGDHNDGHRIIANDIYGYNSYGIMLYRNAQTLSDVPLQSVEHCTIAFNSVRKISGARPSDYEVPGTLIFGAGIYIQGAEYTSVTGNQIDSTCINTNNELLAPGGIGFANVGNGTASENIITHSFKHGIFLNNTLKYGDTTGKMLIQANEIDGGLGSGFRVHLQGNVSFNGNGVSDFAVNGAYVDNASGDLRRNYQFNNNLISKVGGTALNYSYVNSLVATGNIMDTAGVHGISVNNSVLISANNNLAKHITGRAYDIGATNSGTITLNTNHASNATTGYLLNAYTTGSGNTTEGNTTDFSGTYAGQVTFAGPASYTVNGSITSKDSLTSSGQRIYDIQNASASHSFRINNTQLLLLLNNSLIFYQNLLPAGDNNLNLGSATQRMRKGWFSDSLNVKTRPGLDTDSIVVKSNGALGAVARSSIGGTDTTNLSKRIDSVKARLIPSILSVDTTTLLDKIVFDDDVYYKNVIGFGPTVVNTTTNDQFHVAVTGNQVNFDYNDNNGGFINMGYLKNLSGSDASELFISGGVYGRIKVQNDLRYDIPGTHWLHTNLFVDNTGILYSSNAIQQGSNAQLRWTNGGATLDPNVGFKRYGDQTLKLFGSDTSVSGDLKLRYVLADSLIKTAKQIVGLVGSPSSKAIAEFNSTTQGVLFPRLTSTQITAMAGDSAGNMVYNRTTGRFNYWDGSVIRAIPSTANITDSLNTVRSSLGSKLDSAKLHDTATVLRTLISLNRDTINLLRDSLRTFESTIANDIIGEWTPDQGAITFTRRIFGANSNGATARTVATTNIFTSKVRLGLVTASTSANQVANARTGNRFATRGNAPGVGGFVYSVIWGISSASVVSAQVAYAGMCATTTDIPGGTDPGVFVDVIGMAKIASSNNMQLIHNDGSGSPTVIDLGANFPSNTVSTDFYQLRLDCAGNGGDVTYTITRLNTNDKATGVLSSNLPSTTTLLTDQQWTSNVAAASLVGIDVFKKYVRLRNQ